MRLDPRSVAIGALVMGLMGELAMPALAQRNQTLPVRGGQGRASLASGAVPGGETCHLELSPSLG